MAYTDGTEEPLATTDAAVQHGGNGQNGDGSEDYGADKIKVLEG